MKIFIISMSSYRERRDFQKYQAENLGLEIEFIDAINGSLLSELDLQQAANNWTRNIFSKDVGCFHSHRKAWDRVSQENEKCLIIEDDVIFSDNIKEILNFISNHSDDWNVAYDLEYVPRKHILGKSVIWKDIKTKSSAIKIYQNKDGLGAYVIGPKLALKAYKEITSYAMIDATFWSRKWIDYRQIEPAPVVQMMHIDKATKGDNVSIHQVRNKNYINNSWMSRKLIRLKISFYELPMFIKALIFGVKREISVNRKELEDNFESLINQNTY
ncbi:glycosyltransferase family 25 protein [SAR86 cluster bacterium]|nr:glycosyltransferase family 25 protein [SAR86 cluster bacterium]